ncbi:N-6 DNA methylase [Dietzia sp. NPDC055877]
MVIAVHDRTADRYTTFEESGQLSLVRSRQRIADHGEVFTPDWLVQAMLDQVREETERIDSRFLEPACGSGNFIVPVLRRKLRAVAQKFGNSDFEIRHYALVAVMSIYGIELLADNIAECRANMLEVLVDQLQLSRGDDLYDAASHVLGENLVHGDAMTMLNNEGQPITFAEWGYLGKGRFQRRDFRMDALTQSSAFGESDTLFADSGKHEIFRPITTYPTMGIRDMAMVAK